MLQIETGKDNPILRTVCEPIRSNEIKQYVKIGKQMLKYVKNPEHRGIGLAGPQIGVEKRIIVASLIQDWEDENFSTVMMINPEILEHSPETNKDSEGCLSLPKKTGDVERWSEIKLTYLDEKGKSRTIKLRDRSARIVQHEIDHLDGVLFIDKLVK